MNGGTAFTFICPAHDETRCWQNGRASVIFYTQTQTKTQTLYPPLHVGGLRARIYKYVYSEPTTTHAHILRFRFCVKYISMYDWYVYAFKYVQCVHICECKSLRVGVFCCVFELCSVESRASSSMLLGSPPLQLVRSFSLHVVPPVRSHNTYTHTSLLMQPHTKLLHTTPTLSRSRSVTKTACVRATTLRSEYF